MNILKFKLCSICFNLIEFVKTQFRKNPIMNKLTLMLEMVIFYICRNTYFRIFNYFVW